RSRRTDARPQALGSRVDLAHREVRRARHPDLVRLYALDGEPRGADRRHGVAVEIAAVHHPPPDGIADILQQRAERAFAAHVLEEAYGRPWTQNAAQFLETARGNGNRAEDQGSERRVEAAIRKRQRLRIAVLYVDARGNGTGPLRRERAELVEWLDGG